MNKIESTGNLYRVVNYDGEQVSKNFKTLKGATDALEKIRSKEDCKLENSVLRKSAYDFAAADVARAKEHKSITIIDTKVGIVFLEYWENVFRIKYGKKLLRTDNELTIIDILKRLYNFEFSTFVSPKRKKSKKKIE